MRTNKDAEPVEVNISADTVSILISMARRFDAEPDATESDFAEPDMAERQPANSITDLTTGMGEQAPIANAITEELREAIDDLNDDEVVDLIALAWVGRGDFGREDWAQARSLARDRHHAHSATYLMGMPALGDYLEEGLAALGHDNQEP